jgi:hypothetical protein
MTLRLWLVRHGATDWSDAGKLTGACEPLGPLGKYGFGLDAGGDPGEEVDIRPVVLARDRSRSGSRSIADPTIPACQCHDPLPERRRSSGVNTAVSSREPPAVDQSHAAEPPSAPTASA